MTDINEIVGNEVSVQTYKTTDQFIKEFKSFDDAKIKQLSEAWDAIRDVAWSEARSEAWSEPWSEARSEAWNAAWYAIRDEARSAAWYVAWYADLAVLVKDKITAEQFEILTSPWTSCGLSLFVEAEEVETHAQDIQMTNEELIAQARELCEKRVAEYQATLDNYQEKSGAGYEWTLTQLNAWTTHLAEMDEHEEICGEMGMGDAHKPMCSYDEDSYPCDFLLTKSKRLLGVK